MIYAVNKKTKRHIVIGFTEQLDRSDWTVVHADAEGWIPWPGGKECPLPCNAVFDIRLRGELPVPVQASSKFPHTLRWTHDGSGGDIVAYRPILAAQPEPFVSVDMASQRGRTVWCRAARVAVTAPEWAGEGLPPVGAECELAVSVIASFDDLKAMGEVPEGARVVISGRADFGYGEAAVYGGVLDGIWFYGIHKAAAFRPIRSDEDRAVEAMLACVDQQAHTFDREDDDAFCRALYRGGYRKTEVPNEDA